MESLKITIVIPTRDRPKKLAQCLGSLAEQEGGGEFDVLVIDDAGHTDARIVADDFQTKLAIRALRLDQPCGAAAVRNVAFDEVPTGWIGFLDDDAIPQFDWVKVGRACLTAWPTVAAMVGRILAVDEVRLLSIARQRIYDERDSFYQSTDKRRQLFERFQGRHPSNCLPADYLSGGNMWIRREAVGSDIRFPATTLWGHDRAFADSLIAAGHLLTYVPELVIRHHHEPRFAPCLQRGILHAYYSELGRTDEAQPLSLRAALIPAWRQLSGQPAEGIPRANTEQKLPGRAVLAFLTAAYHVGRFVAHRKRTAQQQRMADRNAMCAIKGSSQ